MKILYTFSFLLFFSYFPVDAHVVGSEGAKVTQQCNTIERDINQPFQSSKYDSLEFIVLDEDTEFDETAISHFHEAENIEFQSDFLVVVIKNRPYHPNLITFGTDSSPPIS